MIQSKFGLPDFKSAKPYGGRLRNKANGRGARPLCTKRSIHLVLWSSQAIGAKSFIKQDKYIKKLLNKLARKFGVKVYRVGNASNHLHLLIKLTNRFTYRAFIKALTGVLALKLKIKWDFRPFTRIVEWGRHFKRVCAYVYLNELEGYGAIPYQKNRLRGVALSPP